MNVVIMPAPTAPIDISSLIAPLDGPANAELNGAGADLRFDPVYKEITDARRQENARLPQGIWAHEVKRADWLLVERLCVDILRARSKDLQVACWLAEAVVHRVGYAGLAPGFRLLAALCRQFWPCLYPIIDDGDLAPRLAPFEWLNSRFPPLLRNLPIVCATTTPEVSYTWTDYINAQLLDGLRQRDPKSVERSEAAGAVSLAAFVSARERTETQFWQQNMASLQAAATALEELNATLEELCGREAPGLGGIDEAIKDLLNLTAVALSERQRAERQRIERQLAEVPPASTQVARQEAARLEASRPTPVPQPSPVFAATPQGPMTTREEAYAQLAEIAELLHRLEPHSPVPYLIDRAVAWGGLSFAELVSTFARAGLDLGMMFDVLGLAAMAGEPESNEGGDQQC